MIEFSNEVVNSQELFCQLQPCRLQSPDVDNWDSIKNVIRPYVDCWFGGATPAFKADGNKLETLVEGDVVFKMEYDASAEYPLKIEVWDFDEDDYYGDSYRLTFYNAKPANKHPLGEKHKSLRLKVSVEPLTETHTESMYQLVRRGESGPDGFVVLFPPEFDVFKAAKMADAVPELLEACKRIVGYVDENAEADAMSDYRALLQSLGEIADFARAAITKATKGLHSGPDFVS